MSALGRCLTPIGWRPWAAPAFWRGALGRGMELQFNCAVDDSGNEIELDDFAWGDDDTVTEDALTRKRPALCGEPECNAVAMRADRHAWLDLPRGRRGRPSSGPSPARPGRHAAAANAPRPDGADPDQRRPPASALLRGRRALARQTLAPLLARPEAADAEIKVSFDPAWSGYFEYAGYLA